MLPVYDFELKVGDKGVECISLVHSPANEEAFIMLGKEREIAYLLEDESKHNLTGVLLRANFPVYREDDQRGRYWLRWKPEVIEAVRDRYHINKVELFDIEHSGKEVKGITLVEDYIKSANKVDRGFEHIEDGSWIGTVHCDNEEAWGMAKEAFINGFSPVISGHTKISGEMLKEQKGRGGLLSTLLRGFIIDFTSPGIDSELKAAYTNGGVIRWQSLADGTNIVYTGNGNSIQQGEYEVLPIVEGIGIDKNDIEVGRVIEVGSNQTLTIGLNKQIKTDEAMQENDVKVLLQAEKEGILKEIKTLMDTELASIKANLSKPEDVVSKEDMTKIETQLSEAKTENESLKSKITEIEAKLAEMSKPTDPTPKVDHILGEKSYDEVLATKMAELRTRKTL